MAAVFLFRIKTKMEALWMGILLIWETRDGFFDPARGRKDERMDGRTREGSKRTF